MGSHSSEKNLGEKTVTERRSFEDFIGQDAASIDWHRSANRRSDLEYGGFGNAGRFKTLDHGYSSIIL